MVVEQSACDLKFEGLNPAVAAIERERMIDFSSINYTSSIQVTRANDIQLNDLQYNIIQHNGISMAIKRRHSV